MAVRKKRIKSDTKNIGGTDLFQLNLKKFDPSRIRPYSTLLFAGGRGTGKSFLMRDIIYHLKKRFYDMYVFSGTQEDDHPWTDLSPKKYVNICREVFPNSVLKNALDVQEQRMEIGRQIDIKVPPTAYVFEDLEFLTKPIWNVPGVREIWFNGRHSKTYAFCAFQYIMEIKMSLRGMFDYAFFTMDNNVKSRERIRDQFGGVFPSDEAFENIFFACTTNYKAMVIDLRARSYNIEDCVFWYRAIDHGPFKVGIQEVWDKAVEEENKEKIKKRNKGLVIGGGKSRERAKVLQRKKDRVNMAINLEDYEESPKPIEEEIPKKEKKKQSRKKSH